MCDRCNYTKDCCCTFSCKHCGKRVFSIMAYTMHQDKTCSVLKQRRERIRMAIMEKRRRREDPSLPELPQLPPILPETPLHTSGRYMSQRNLMLHEHRKRTATKEKEPEKTSASKEKKVKETTERKEELPVPPPATPSTQGDAEGDDSSSGSLTDLSTFTSPNILQPVTNTSE